MILDEESTEPSLQSEFPPRDNVPFPSDGVASNRSDGQDDESKSDLYFIGKVASLLLHQIIIVKNLWIKLFLLIFECSHALSPYLLSGYTLI